jgi:glutaconate CoA-transferase subunit B
VTDLGILEPDEAGELVLAAVHPGIDPEQARAQTGWELHIAPALRTTVEVTPGELSLLRQLDPQRIYLN